MASNTEHAPRGERKRRRDLGERFSLPPNTDPDDVLRALLGVEDARDAEKKPSASSKRKMHRTARALEIFGHDLSRGSGIV
jgi:hypothetical protein